MRRTMRKVFASIVGVVLVGTCVVAYSAPLGTLEPCRTLDVSESTPESVTDGLVAQGWYGDPNDGTERLYAPLCRV